VTVGVKHHNTYPHKQLHVGSNNQSKNIKLAFLNDENVLAQDTASVSYLKQPSEFLLNGVRF